jgi:hypothetical protein
MTLPGGREHWTEVDLHGEQSTHSPLGGCGSRNVYKSAARIGLELTRLQSLPSSRRSTSNQA